MAETPHPVTWTNVTDQAPELARVSNGAQTAILKYVNTTIKVANFGSEASPKLFMARVMLAAHMGTISRRRGQPGARTAQSSGGVSESFTGVALTGLAALYATTAYGIEYVRLVGTSAARAGLVLNRRVIVTGTGGSGC